MPTNTSTLTRYDEMIVIATNKPHLLQIVRWGTQKSCWRFLLTLNGDEPFETGQKYSTKSEILKASVEMALVISAPYFEDKHLSISSCEQGAWIQLNSDEVNSLLSLEKSCCDEHINRIKERI